VTIRLEDLLASFRRHLRAAAKAPRTIELYSQSVRYYSRWLVDRGRPATLDELTRHAVSAWLAELAETCEPSTLGTRLRGIRRFCRWLVTEGELEVAPTDGIEIPSPPEKPVPILTDDEIADFSRPAPSSTWTGSSPTSRARAHARGSCRSARRPPRPSTATSACEPCIPTPAPPGCCSASAAR